MIQGRLNRMEKELKTLFLATRPPVRKIAIVIFAPILVDRFTDPDECRGMPFLINGLQTDGIQDLADLIEYVNKPDIECALICRQMPFDGEYIETIQTIHQDQESSWRLIGHLDNVDTNE